MGFLAYNHPHKEKAFDHIGKLFLSTSTLQKISGLQIVGEMKVHHFSDHVASLITHEDETIRRNACIVAGKLADPKMLSVLLQLYGKQNSDKHILKALELAGEAAVEPIRQYMHTHNLDAQTRHQLFVVLGKIGTDDAAGLLQESLEKFPSDEYHLLSILYQPQFGAPPDKQVYISLLKKNMENASAQLSALDALRNNHHAYHLLIRSIELELLNIRDKCLFLFSFLFDRDKIRKSKIGFELNTKESTANAYELVDMVVPREFSDPFILIFEQEDPSIRNMQLSKFFKIREVSAGEVIADILQDDANRYNEWTKSCCLYEFREQPELLQVKLVEPYLKSDNLILKETATFILEEISESNDRN